MTMKITIDLDGLSLGELEAFLRASRELGADDSAELLNDGDTLTCVITRDSASEKKENEESSDTTPLTKTRPTPRSTASSEPFDPNRIGDAVRQVIGDAAIKNVVDGFFAPRPPHNPPHNPPNGSR